MLLPTPAARPRPVRTGVPQFLVDRPHLLAAAGILASGLAGVLAKLVYAEGGEPLSFLAIRLAAAVGVLGMLARESMWQLPGRRILVLLGLGVVFAGQSLSYFGAIAMSPIALVVVVVSAYPVVVALQDALANRAWPPRTHLAAMAATLVGLWLAAGAPTSRPNPGLLLAVVSGIGYAVYLRLSQRALDGVRPMVATGWVMTGALVTVLAGVLFLGPAWPSLSGVAVAALHGIVATTFPIVALYAAIKRLPVSQVAALGPIEPVAAILLAALALGELLGPVEILGVGGALAASTVLAGIRPRAGLPRLPYFLPRMGRIRPLRVNSPASTGTGPASRCWSGPAVFGRVTSTSSWR